MDKAQRFFDSLRLAEERDEALVPFAEDVEGYEAASDADPEAIEAFICAAGDRGTGTVAELDRHAFASAAADPDGQIIVADTKFASWLTNADLTDRIVGQASGNRPRVMVVASSLSGRPVAVASARGAATRNWPLDGEVLRALETGKASHALLAFTPRVDSWANVAETFGLTPSEARLLAALARTGDLRDASTALDIAYETALQLAAGSIVAPARADAIFAELFGLSIGRAKVARRVANGETREQAAKSLGISAARAKADLKAIYVACDVATAVDLSRLVAEVDALAGLAEACDIELFGTEVRNEPLRLLRRRDRQGRIAFADHGPVGGYPVLVFHTTTSGRAQSPHLLAALVQHGYRPVVIERPGYGLTDMADGHIWDATATDVGDVLVGAGGFTLYGFTTDSDGVPTCLDGCASAWPPLLVDSADVPAGLDSAVFSVVERSNGGFQLEAGAWPLYFYAGDTASGDVNGQASGDVWFVAAPDGSLIGADEQTDATVDLGY